MSTDATEGRADEANGADRSEGPAAPAQAPKRTLTPTALELLSASDEERIAHIQRDKFIPYAAGNEILEKMEELLNHQVVSRPPNMLIVAASNNGKSALLDEFLSRHSGSDNIGGSALHMPVVLVDAPPEPKRTDFEDAMLRALRLDPKNNVDKRASIISCLKRYRTRVIALDEVNSLLAGSPMSQRKILNFIRSVSNESQVSIVMAGTKEMLNVAALDDQTDKRFPPRLIKRWRPASKDFKQFLWTYEATLPLKKASNLHKQAEVIYELTTCLMGDVVQLLKDSAVKAILRRRPDEEFIDENLLRKCHVVRRVTMKDLDML